MDILLFFVKVLKYVRKFREKIYIYKIILNYWLKRLDMTSFKHKSSNQRIRNNGYKIEGTDIIYSPMSPPSLSGNRYINYKKKFFCKNSRIKNQLKDNIKLNYLTIFKCYISHMILFFHHDIHMHTIILVYLDQVLFTQKCSRDRLSPKIYELYRLSLYQ